MRTHRLQSDEFILHKPLDKILRDWGRTTQIGRRRPSLGYGNALGFRGSWQSRKKYCALWMKEIAPLWTRTLLWHFPKMPGLQSANKQQVLPDIKKGCTRIPPGVGWAESPNFRSGTVFYNVFIISKSKSTIFLLARSDATNSKLSANPQSGDIDDDDSELTIETEAELISLAMRYLGYDIAWIPTTEFRLSIQRMRHPRSFIFI